MLKEKKFRTWPTTGPTGRGTIRAKSGRKTRLLTKKTRKYGMQLLTLSRVGAYLKEVGHSRLFYIIKCITLKEIALPLCVCVSECVCVCWEGTLLPDAIICG